MGFVRVVAAPTRSAPCNGFNFLGFNLRRYRHRNQPAKLLITPSPDAVRRIRKRLADELRSLRGKNAMTVIARLNPITRGWAAYYRGVVSSKVFASLDDHMWWLISRWALRSHPNKSRKWIMRRYFGRFNKFRNDRWVFGARGHAVNDRGDIAHLVKFAWTAIVRHQLVAGRASPDDPDLIDYWATRRRKAKPALDNYNLNLLAKQDRRCPLCGDRLLTLDQPPQSQHERERWWLGVTRRAARRLRIMTEYSVSRRYADARVSRIYGGSTEIMKTVVSKSLGLVMRFILASASPARLRTLREAGVEPEVIVSGVDESTLEAGSPTELPQVIAEAKLRAVRARVQGDALILGCDSLLEFDGGVYGKPGRARMAAERWKAMRGRSGILHTGHGLMGTKEVTLAAVPTVVHFADVTDEEIERYCATGEPAIVAGGFTLDGLGGWSIDGIEGDPHNVVGVSLPVLRRMLREQGFELSDIGYPTRRWIAQRRPAPN